HAVFVDLDVERRAVEHDPPAGAGRRRHRLDVGQEQRGQRAARAQVMRRPLRQELDPEPRERPQRFADRLAVLGQRVDVPRAVVDRPALDQPVPLEGVEPLHEQLRGDPDQLPAEVGEALRTERQLAQHEERPAIADDVERARHPAVLLVAPQHPSLTVPFMNRTVPFMNSSASPRHTYSERAVLLVAGTAVFAVFLDTTILFVAFSSIGESFPDATTSTLSWILNAYT